MYGQCDNSAFFRSLKTEKLNVYRFRMLQGIELLHVVKFSQVFFVQKNHIILQKFMRSRRVIGSNYFLEI